jgi:hypothetical protein
MIKETMMSAKLYQLFEMDHDLEREGISVNYGSVKFQIARAGGRNKAFKDIFNAKTKKHRTQLDNETMSEDMADRIMAESYAEGIILGWWTRKEDESGEPILKKNEEQWDDVIENKEGKRVKYSVEECVRLFLDLPDLFLSLQSYAMKAGNYKKELDEEDMGNLDES